MLKIIVYIFSYQTPDFLYDLYKKDFHSDLVALTNVGKRISGYNELIVRFSPEQLIYTDGRHINIPNKYKNKLPISRGLVAHESGHIGYGSFELSVINLINDLMKRFSLPRELVVKLINVVEDVRVNLINKIHFPGFYNDLRDFTHSIIPETARIIYINEKVTEINCGIIKKVSLNELFFTNWNIYLIQWPF